MSAKAFGIMILCMVIFAVIFTYCSPHSSTKSERTMGRCWICGKKGSYQMDGSYYCHEHYKQRMFGEIG